MTPEQMSYWHKLLHYRPNMLNNLVSQVDAPDFFIAKNGKHSPIDELDEFVKVLNSEKAQFYVCKFPLRYKWLKRTIQNSWKFTTDSCEYYQAFVGKLDAKNISLVFSSFYVNNPGSTFGHTFLRVSRYKDFNQNELLDYAFNFAAADSKDNPALYMLKGLLGYYPGKFSVVPYYYKIREYNDHEFRDIWDYNLELNQEQVNRVVDHLWELSHAHFDYYYFTENCSYHILGLLNVAYDKTNLLDSLNSFYVLPIDTVKVMKDLGLTESKKVRGSVYRKLIDQTKDLTNEELQLINEAAENPKASKKFEAYSDEKAANLQDATISALDYLKAEKVLLNDPKTRAEREELLVQRAINPHISEEIVIDQAKMNAPDEGHDSSRVGVSTGYNDGQGAFGGFEWRAAQHDILDPSQGHLKNSQVVMFDVRVKNKTIDYDKHKFVLDRFRLFDLKKYQPSDFWKNSISFDGSLGLEQRRDCNSQDCVDPIMTFGAGSTVDLSNDMYLSLLFGGIYLYDKEYQNNSLLSLGPKINLSILKEGFSTGIDIGYFMPSELFEEWLRRRITYDLDFRYFLKRNTSLFLKSTNIDQDVGMVHEVQAGAYFFF